MGNEIKIIEEAFNNIEKINSNSEKEILDAINHVIEKIDNGSLRVADKNDTDWNVNEYAKKAILLYFRIKEMKLIPSGPDHSNWL